MAAIERFEDIDAWREARVLVKEIYEMTSDGKFARDFGLKDQIQRSGASVMSSIAEGLERGSNKDFARFLFMAKGSAGELRSQFYVAPDFGYLEQEKARELMEVAQSVSRRISGFIKYLQTSS